MYAELHCKTNFSFLEGASHADDLVARAMACGYSAIAVTDSNSLSGVVRAHSAAREIHETHRDKLKLIIGAEITLEDALPVVLWAPNRTAYGKLSRLITVGRRRAEKGQCILYWQDLVEHAGCGTEGGLLAGVDGRHAESLQLEQLTRYRELFGDHAYLLTHLHLGPEDNRLVQRYQELSRASGLPLLAAGDVRYHVPARMVLHDIMTAIRNGTSVPEGPEHLLPNSQHHLRELEELETLYRDIPDALKRTLEVAERCTFSLDELRYEYPEELAPDGMTPFQFLEQLSWTGARGRYPDGVPDKVRKLISHELKLIEEMRYEAYFLTVWDLVRFAREQGILCQGRGSAANSAVCYCLGVTSVDPDRADLLFERFVSKERDEAPDIDVDFEHERREEVLQYLYAKYGRDRAGLAAEVITYRQRSAIRDVGKALGLSLDRVDALAKQVEGYSSDDNFVGRCQQVGIDPESQLGRRLVYGVSELVGFPRHLGQHVGGMVMTQGPLCELVPIENAAMADRTVISWDKNDLEDLGMLKVDCLSLGMLTAIRKCFEMIEQHHGQRLTLANIPQEDSDVYDMICKADTMGVFQIESRAQMSMLPRLRPRKYYDLVIEVAIVRPGPIQGNMVHPFLRRRMGLEEPVYPNEEIKQVLHKTLGVPIFQEQAMRLAVVAAGFTPGEADQLRRAMGAWRKTGVIDKFRKKLYDGMLAKGLSEEFADQVFRQIRGFGEYGFPESHAASFALLVYVSCWLKHHYPSVFTAGLLNSQPMGFYAPGQLLRDLREHGGEIRPIDVNHSFWDVKLEPDLLHPPPGRVASFTSGEGESKVCVAAETESDHASPSPGLIARLSRGESEEVGKSETKTILPLRLGLRLIIGFSERHARIIEQARESGPFLSIDDFTQRTSLNQSVIQQLSDADAFRSLGQTRRAALWHALAQDKTPRDTPLFNGLVNDADDSAFQLPEMHPIDEVFRDYATTGLSLKAHPLSFYRDQLNEMNVTPHEQLASLRTGRRVRVAGLVIMRQRPATAKGITFVTIEDETGIANLVVHPSTWERFYPVARRGSAWLAHGRVENKHEVIHVVIDRLELLGEKLKKLHAPSRDFR